MTRGQRSRSEVKPPTKPPAKPNDIKIKRPDGPPHFHKWQANGIVEIDGESCSPVSRFDDLLYTNLYSVAVCECGKVNRVYVGRKNVRRRGAR